MKEAYRKKFIFTQLSAPIIGFAGSFLLLMTIKAYFPEILDLNTGPFYMKLAMLIGFFLFGLIGSMYLWGLILSYAGILSKEEVKGYPFSKPWKHN